MRSCRPAVLSTGKRSGLLVVMAAGRCQRDLFPLPVPGLPPGPAPQVCRAVRRRVLRRNHADGLVRDAVVALYELAAAPGAAAGQVSTGQRQCLDRVRGACSRMGRPPPLPPAGALRALCGASVLYDQDEARTAPYVFDQVS